VTAFADALTVTTPSTSSGPPQTSPAVRDVLDAAGATLEFENEAGQVFRAGCLNGVCRVSSRARVNIIYASGQFLAHLRSQNLYAPYVSALSLEPHRVTRLDATLDVVAEAPPIIAALAALGRAEKIALSRKVIKRGDVKTVYGCAEYDPSILTGSVYLGDKSTAKIHLLCYDKRHERMQKQFPDPGPLVRYELVVRSEMGPTLRDACDPTEMFYHFVAPDILARPVGVASWVPHAEGFALEKLTLRTPMEKMFALLDTSPDVARLLQFAADAGPGGMRLLSARLERMAVKLEPTPVPFTGTGAPRALPVGGSPPHKPPDRLQ
jgi:hypothetical protein